MTDPFSLDEVDNDSDDPLPLINIATGVVMPQDVTRRLLSCYELGRAQMTTFVEERLNTNEVLFWNALPNRKITRPSPHNQRRRKLRQLTTKQSLLLLIVTYLAIL